MRCTFYLPTYEKETIVVHKHNDDGTWSLGEFDWLGFCDYGTQKNRFRMDGLKPYVMTDEYETTIPIIKRIADKRMHKEISDIGLQIKTDKRYWHREFIEAAVTEHQLIVITHRVSGKLYRDDDMEISCKVAFVDLHDWTQTLDNGRTMDHTIGGWRFNNYDHELKSIDPSKVIRMITEAEARKIAFDVFTARMDRYIEDYKEYIGVKE